MDQSEPQGTLEELLEQLRNSRNRSQVLSRRLMEAQEAERRRIARELHDEIGQSLTAVKINLLSVDLEQLQACARLRLEESIDIADRVLQQVRDLSLDLRPSLLDDLGLLAALRWYLDRQAQRAGFSLELVSPPELSRFSSSVETACFRTVQEAVTNIVRHAQAKKVCVELSHSPSGLDLCIRDDGIGFDVEKARHKATQGGSLGLLGMQERVALAGGRFEVDSAPGRGAEIRVVFPAAHTHFLERRERKRNA